MVWHSSVNCAVVEHVFNEALHAVAVGCGSGVNGSVRPMVAEPVDGTTLRALGSALEIGDVISKRVKTQVPTATQ